MRAARLLAGERGGDLALVETDIPVPQAGEGLIRVHAAGITNAELSWYPTLHTAAGAERVGAIPSHEFSGVTPTGEEIFGMNDWFADGAAAEYCVAKLSALAPKPPRLTHAEAASVPIGALTAWQGLFDRAALQPGERVLVHGGAGSVGAFAVQLARWRGARVTATVSSADLEFVAGLGAELAIDYQASRFEDGAGLFDIIFDTAGGETLERSWAVLKPNGRLVTIASENEASSEERVKRAFFIVEPNGEQLATIGGMLQAGTLVPGLAAAVPLSRVADAYAGRVERRGRGKIVVEI